MESQGNAEKHIEPSKDLNEMRERMNKAIALKRELSRRWRRSLWRILPPPILAYAIVGSYYHWILRISDGWFKALGPVVVVLTFNITTPYIQSRWYRSMTKKIIAERAKGEKTDR